MIKFIKLLGKRRQLSFCLGLAVAFFFCADWFLRVNPFPSETLDQLEASPELTDRNGRSLSRRLNAQQQWRIPVDLGDFSPWLKKATIAVEDERFYRHPGVDPLSIGRASLQNLLAGGVVSGASTLDMQLCRMLDPRPRTFAVKISEVARAWQADNFLSKDEILEAYLNLAPYGGNLQGGQAAALRYFGKPVTELSLSEAALLAGIPQSPARLRPDRRPEASRQRRNKVLNRMFVENMISRERYLDAILQPLGLEETNLTAASAHHFVAAALSRRPSGGQTFLDPDLQADLRRVAAARMDELPSGSDLGIVVIEIETGGVLAMLGGLHFDKSPSGQVNAVTAWRSPGSTLKPFVYATAALERRLNGDTILTDAPFAFSGWTPGNFDRTFSGEVKAGDALRRSLNMPALQVCQAVGAAKVAGIAEGCGVRFREDPVGKGGLAFVLGGVETNLLDLTNAYATIGRQGIRRNIRFFQDDAISEAAILDPLVCSWLGEELSSWRLPSTHFESISSFSTPWFMRKTGTSSGRRDAWAVGHNGRYAVGVWAGRPSGMGDQAFVGAHVAEPLLAEIFNLAKIRRTDSPCEHEGWAVTRAIPLPSKNILTIERPESGAVFRSLEGALEIRPKANLTGDYFWYLNGRQLNDQQSRSSFVGSGTHELLCLRASGEYALSRFRVY